MIRSFFIPITLAWICAATASARAETPNGPELVVKPISYTSVADGDWCGEINSVVRFQIEALPRPARGQKWLDVPATRVKLQTLLNTVYGHSSDVTYRTSAQGKSAFEKLIADLDPTFSARGELTLGSCQPNEILADLRVQLEQGRAAKSLTWMEGYFTLEAQARSRVPYRHHIVIDPQESALTVFLIW